MTEKYVWSNIKKQVREWTKECIRCQKYKVTGHTISEFDEYQAPDKSFSVVHIDLIGPLPPSEGMMYCLTCIDRFSSGMEVVHLPDITAEIVGKAIYEHWICRFGVSATIITDQGRQIESQLFRKIAAIRGIRPALRPDINHTITQMVYGTCIKLPGEFFDQPTINKDPQNFVTKLQQHMEDIKPLKLSSTRKQKIFVHKELKSCSHVFVRIDRVKNTLEPPYEGPFVVVRKLHKYFTIVIKGKQVNISVDRLKPSYLLELDHDNGHFTAEHKNANPNSVDPPLMPDKQPTTSRGIKIHKPVRFRE
ncbi:retrovirus-related Pol polyprotein from transposon opus [Nephila pilipes]|uniref:Retrovirus-related Pol polyprotein from transposon opus n=1 Tax=Nephila pilipes TaxID=299642 RepID=A0A8X6QB72_NEPPI|nr:retrovirus-related Pol polyprotein from transposon opus [Nephila pilipes]